MTAVGHAPRALARPALRSAVQVTTHSRTWAWGWALAAAAGVLYAAAGVWLLGRGHYAIGDAIVRAANARTIVFGRDPHLGALGMVWMPLPVLAQLPFVAVLEPLGLSRFSGVLTTSAATALTVRTLVQAGRHAGASPRLTALVVAAFALNPVTVLWAATGMAEPLSLLGVAIALVAYLRWSEFPASGRLAVIGLGLAIVTLARYEGAVIAIVVAAAVAHGSPRGGRLSRVVVVLLPTLAALACWLIVNQLLRGDAFHWYGRMRELVTPGEDASWLPADRSVASSVRYVLERCVRFAPALLLIAPFAVRAELARRRDATRLGVAVVVAAAAAFPAFVLLSLLQGRTYGVPRYFAGLIVFVTIAALWLLGTWTPGRERSGVRMAILAGLVITTVMGTITELDAKITTVEKERGAMRMLLGLDGPIERASSGRTNLDVVSWQRLTAWLDDHVAPDELVAADSAVSFPALLFTERPGMFLVPEDRTFRQELAFAEPRFDWVLAGRANEGLAGTETAVLDAVVGSGGAGHRWQRVFATPAGTVYRRQSSRTSP